MKKRPHAVRDFALYLLISLTVAALILIGAIRNWPRSLILGGFAFCGITACVFVTLLQTTRRMWKLRLFWPWIGLLLTLHSLILITLIRRDERLGQLWWMFIFEAAIFNE